ncbi:MAG: hypothetical protein Q8T08_21645, partial [Ignavibacteria bacterium]|nr:hypothetical protein [Ignavibacteria bacterium]
MRKYFIIFFVLIIQTANAQFKDGLLHLRTGMSVPLFEYASYDLDDGCFTMTGFSTSVGFSSKVYKNWGLEVQGGFQLHPVEVAILGYYKVQDDPFLLDVTIRSEPYRVIHFVGGPNYSFSTKKWNYTFEVLAGFFYS